MSWLRKKGSTRVDPDKLNQQAEEAIRITSDQQERVNTLTSYLNNRKNQNGFGEDFEYTLRPRGVN